MKVQPINNRFYTDSKQYEKYANLIGVNAEELDDFHEVRIMPSRYETRKIFEMFYGVIDEFANDLYDLDVEFETRRDNRKTEFIEKLSIADINELSAEDLIAYHQFLIDYKKSDAWE